MHSMPNRGEETESGYREVGRSRFEIDLDERWASSIRHRLRSVDETPPRERNKRYGGGWLQSVVAFPEGEKEA